uniref:Kinesin-like protein n=1 Tax=Terrapene triunguis TaxID=2587831 RepID=A0A674JTA5_9SAUR
MVSVLPTEEGNVAVVVRVRPQTQQEQEGSRHAVVQVIDDSMLVFDPEEPCLSGVFTGFRGHDAPKRKGKDLKFVFDQVFGESATQEEVFQHTTKEILDGVLNGYNCSVFAYGATGAGKTYTMLGSEKSPGIMYLTMVELYKRIEARKEEKSCEVLISYQEVYNEQIHDLLEPKGPLAIREDPEKGVVVQGLSFHQPKSAEQLLEMLASGNRNRTQHPTDANATSSRSHAVFQIYVKQQDRVVGITQDLQVAKMSLIDLAGSERASATNTKGERLREGANINRSLLALINVINALADAKSRKSHIPYRDSKLTRLLKDSLGGNCRTIMIAAISPSALAYEDTYNTLKYANRAKEIKLSVGPAHLCPDLSLYGATVLRGCWQVATLREKLQAYERNTQDPDHQVPAPQAQSTRWQVELLRYVSLIINILSFREPEQLVLAVLHVAQRQYFLLKAANLLTPDMVSEFEELEYLVQRETGRSQEPAGTLGGSEVTSEKRAAPMTRAVTRSLQKLVLVPSPSAKTPSLPTKKRKRSEMSSPSKIGTPATPKLQAKRQRKSSLPGRRRRRGSANESAAPPVTISHSTPIVKEAKPAQLVPYCTPKPCPTTVTKSRVPLTTSAAQNCCTPATLTIRDLNLTFDLAEDSCSSGVDNPVKFSAPEFPGWENVQFAFHPSSSEVGKLRPMRSSCPAPELPAREATPSPSPAVPSPPLPRGEHSDPPLLPGCAACAHPPPRLSNKPVLPL